MHYSYEALEWTPADEAGWQYAGVKLDKGDSAVNPASTKPERALHGPCVVVYERSRMSINAYVDPERVPEEVARRLAS